MASSPSLTTSEKKHWWMSNRKIVDKYVKDARNLMSTQDKSDVALALPILDAALSLSPRYDVAIELKARCLLYLKRFKDVANMLQDYIPSLKMSSCVDDSGSSVSDLSSQQLSRERVKLLGADDSESGRDYPSFKCFSVSDLKKKVMAGLSKNSDKEGQWRYLVLGRACCHLGLMEDAMVLLQTGKRLSTAAFRRESISWSEDSFNLSDFPISSDLSTSTIPSTPPRGVTELESITNLLSHIKFLLRRRAAAIAALDAGLYSEAVRHFTKIIEGRRGPPQGFLAQCYMHRAFAYKSLGRIAESIADCNKTLALDPSCILALDTRASLWEIIRCLPDCLHDLEHLKLLYNAILRDRKLPGPAWKRQNVSYREIPGKLCALTTKIQQLKQRVASGETGNVDYYALIGLRRGCSRSELERAYLLLSLRHRPDKAISFVDKCEFVVDNGDVDSVKDRAKISALLLYRLLQKGYSTVKANILEEEAAERQKKKAAAALQAAIQVQQATHDTKSEPNMSTMVTFSNSGTSHSSSAEPKLATSSGSTNPSVFQGIFCRDLAAVGSLLSQAGFNRAIPLKYEALSC